MILRELYDWKHIRIGYENSFRLSGKMAGIDKLSHAELASLKRKFLERFAKKSQNQLNILITGKNGVGKSRLVNSLVGRPVAKEERERKDNTGDVTPYTAVIESFEVRVWDSPVLQDRTCNEEIYLAKLKDTLKDGFDVMIYCMKMDDKRLYSDDEKAMRALTKGFGDDVWKKAVIALTFANKIDDPDGEDDLAYFKGEENHWRKAIDDVLTNLNIDLKVRNSLAVVPVGDYRTPKLPTGDNWLAELWLNCFCVMTESKDEMPAKSDRKFWKGFVAGAVVGVVASATFNILRFYCRDRRS